MYQEILDKRSKTEVYLSKHRQGAFECCVQNFIPQISTDKVLWMLVLWVLVKSSD